MRIKDILLQTKHTHKYTQPFVGVHKRLSIIMKLQATVSQSSVKGIGPGGYISYHLHLQGTSMVSRCLYCNSHHLNCLCSYLTVQGPGESKQGASNTCIV